MNGHMDESGKINLGPNAMGDDPIHHMSYPSYAEYAVATHELDSRSGEQFPQAQKQCFSRVIFGNLPSGLRSRLDDYATNKTILMESEFAALQKEVRGYTANDAYYQKLKPELARCTP